MNNLKVFEKQIENLTIHHYKKSKIYRELIKKLNFSNIKNLPLNKIPFLPVSLFKELELKSISDNEIFKVLFSSGTTGIPSKIFLDKANSLKQTKVLNSLVQSKLGKKRLPMIIIDKKLSLDDKKSFNAKTAAILGFSIFGKDPIYLINAKNEIDYDILNNFLDRNQGNKIFLFGFTSLVYEFLIKKLDKSKLKHKLQNSILVHGGGWKKMEKMKISSNIFKEILKNKLNISSVINYYGLIEQIGSIFLECEFCGCFVTNKFSNIIIRDSKLNIEKDGKKGLIQLQSILPTSYPGHNILTEDIGKIIKKKCKCNKFEKSFIVYGRMEKSEIRGCSDT